LLVYALIYSLLLVPSVFSMGAMAQDVSRTLSGRPSKPINQSSSPINQPSSEVEDVFQDSSRLIIVPVSVTDGKGKPVLGLTLKDFRLEEEGQQQEIVQIGDPSQVPIELALLIDVSGSVKTRFNFEREAASRFLREVLKANDRVTVFAIDEQPVLIASRATADEAAQKLMTIRLANKMTAFFDTVAAAAKHLDRSSPAGYRRVIVVISDGEDTWSSLYKSARAALDEVQRVGAIFYAINPSDQSNWLNRMNTRGQEEMAQIAQATGGSVFLLNLLEELDSAFRQIATELRSQYLLQYYSSSEAPEGTFRRIVVRLPARPELQVRVRRGYFVTRR